MWAAFCPESLKWHDLAWTCFDLFFFILHSSVFLFLSLQRHSRLVQRLPHTFLLLLLLLHLFLHQSRSCGELRSHRQRRNKQTAIALGFKKKTNRFAYCMMLCLYSVIPRCMFMILNWIIVEKEDHVFFYFVIAIFSFFYDDWFFNVYYWFDQI